MKVDGCAPSQRQPDEPAESDTEETTEESHGASFREEKAAHVTVRCAERLQDANLTAAFEDIHHQSGDNAKGSDGERQTAEQPQEEIKDGKDQPETLGIFHQRKRSEAQWLFPRFALLHFPQLPYPNRHRHATRHT